METYINVLQGRLLDVLEGVNKHIVDIGKERLDYNVRPVLYPYMPFGSAMWFCRPKFSRNNIAKSKQII